jgi:hypothetical protein
MSPLHPEIRRTQMPELNLLAAAAILAALAATPGPAQARSHVPYHLPYDVSFNHNYGPGLLPGTFAYYDGPSTNACWRGSATYLGEDHRRHPCN